MIVRKVSMVLYLATIVVQLSNPDGLYSTMKESDLVERCVRVLPSGNTLDRDPPTTVLIRFHVFVNVFYFSSSSFYIVFLV